MGKQLDANNNRLAQLHSSAMTSEVRHELRDTHNHSHQLLEVKELLWKQRSRNNWMKGSDRNTRFFHTQASVRRQLNRVKGLFDNSSYWFSDTTNIERIAIQYFSSLFSSNTPSLESIHKVMDCISQKVTHDTNNLVLLEFTP